MPCNSKSSLAEEVDAAVEGGAVDVEVAVAVPRVPVEGFLPREEPHVQLVAARALGRASAASVTSALGPGASSSAEPQAVAKRPPLDRQEVAHPPHRAAARPGERLAASKVPRLDSAQRPAAERRIVAAGSRPTSGQLNNFLDVPGPATGAVGAAGAGERAQRLRDERAAQRPISCKAGEDNSRRELPAVPP